MPVERCRRRETKLNFLMSLFERQCLRAFLCTLLIPSCPFIFLGSYGYYFNIVPAEYFLLSIIVRTFSLPDFMDSY